MKTLFGLAALACSVLAAPAFAQSGTINFNNGGTTASPDGDGNARFYTGTVGTTVINVRVTGWSNDGTTVRDSHLASYGAAGLGIISGDDNGGANNQHTIDNQFRKDFLIFQFDRSVSLSTGTFNAYAVNGSAADTDATIAFGTTTADWRTQLAFNDRSTAEVAAMFSGGAASLGTGAGGTRSLNTNGATGNLWLVGADIGNADLIIDGFKFSAVTLNVANASAVPEPATWATMLIGFGAVGSAMRRRSAASAKLAAA